jgi:hypothetical protein
MLTCAVNIAVFAVFCFCFDEVSRLQAGLPEIWRPIRGKSGKKVARMFAIFAGHVATGIAGGRGWGNVGGEMEGIAMTGVAVVNGRRTEMGHECPCGARARDASPSHGHDMTSSHPQAA